MARLRVLFRCIGEAVCANGLKALLSTLPLGEAAFDIAKDAYERLQRAAKEGDGSQAELLAAAAQAGGEETRREAQAAVAEITRSAELPPGAEIQLQLYLERVPSSVRQSLRRPADPSGRTVPPALALGRPEQFAAMLPARLPRFKAGDRPAGVGNWELIELLGAGGFGEVWKAGHPTLAGIPPVALKFCLDESAAAALRHEAVLLSRVMQQAGHPGIVPLRQAYLDADPLCLEYEYVGGGDLAGLIGEWHGRGKPPRDAINAAFLSLVKVVAHAHGLTPPIVHRDLKPANVLVQRTADRKFRLRVADFGIGSVALRGKQEAAANAATRGMLATSLRGSHTPGYASPQQARGDAPDPRDDVHALGVLWFQMLTGDLSGGVPAEWAAALAEAGQPAALAGLLGECVTSKAEKRIADAGELAARLQKLLGAAAPPEAREAPAERVLVAVAAEPARAAEAPRTSRAATGRSSRRSDDEEEYEPARRGRDRDRRDGRHREPSGGVPLSIWVGGGAALLLLVLMLLGVVAMRRTPGPVEIAKAPEVARPANPPGLPDRAWPPAPADPIRPPVPVDQGAPAARAKSANLPAGAIDLLPLIDLRQDIVEGKGKWAVLGGALHCTAGSFVPRVQIPYRPPQEYDYTVTYSQPGLRNGVNLIVPGTGKSGSFAWSTGDALGTYGFQAKPEWIKRKTPGLFAPNTRYTTTLRVRRDELIGLLDGKELLRVATAGKGLDVDTPWFKMRDPSLLGLACDDPTVFENLYLVEVTGKGSKSR